MATMAVDAQHEGCGVPHPRWLTLGWLCALAASAASAAETSGYAGRRLIDAIADLEQRGLAVLYSSDLVRPWMRVGEAPQASEPRALLTQLVAPHGLAVRDGPNGSVLLVKAPRQRRGEAPSADHAPTTRTAELEEVVVATSRYRLALEVPIPIRLAAADLEALPDIGDDPLRAVARLPGTAAGDFTAKTNIRGGEVDEILVRFDGLRLFNPFHLKDFQSVFSAVDPGIIRGIEVYTGAFPAAFGDRMSGVIDIEPLAGSNAPQRELSLSFFNASGRVADSFDAGRGQWLLSARRSNLGMLLEALGDERGSPDYSDAYARLGYQLTDGLSLTGSVLRFHDDLELNDSDFEEQAEADYRDDYYWLRLDYEPGPDLRGRVMLARSQLESVRVGTLDQPGVASGRLEDRRGFTVDSLQTDWQLARSETLALALGAEWRRFEGRYDYSDEAAFDLLFLTPGAPETPVRNRSLSARPTGHQLGAYASVRVEPLPGVTADVGLRWDRESLSPSGGERWSPRVGLLWNLAERTSVRGGWGRYVQSQAINELQISDGVTAFLPPQRADHWVGSIEHVRYDGLKLRVEAYWKEYENLRPRFENLLNSFVLLPELKPDRIRIAPQTASARGIEVTLNRDPDERLGWWLTYAWSSVRDEFVDEAPADRSWDQTHSVSAGLVWQTRDWDLSLAGRYRTGWPTTAFELAAVAPVSLIAVGPRNQERLGAYKSLDARVARKFRFERSGELTVFLEVANLFNRHNACCVEYEMDDEDGPLDLEVETINYLPTLPSLGVIWRF
jgi:outer membrane receptor protein involved in Fe transport